MQELLSGQQQRQKLTPRPNLQHHLAVETLSFPRLHPSLVDFLVHPASSIVAEEVFGDRDSPAPDVEVPGRLLRNCLGLSFQTMFFDF